MTDAPHCCSRSMIFFTGRQPLNVVKTNTAGRTHARTDKPGLSDR